MSNKLFEILEQNKNTEYGKKWDFAKIRTVEEFQDTVPLSDYDDYLPFIDASIRLGKKGVLTDLPMAGYTLTSGTTGVPRLIPCTQKHLEDYIKAFWETSVKGSTILLFGSMPKTHPYMDQTYLDSLSGILIYSQQRRIRDNSHARMFASGAFTSPIEIMVTNELFDTTYLRLLFALLDKKVEQIVAPFTWGVLELFLYLEKNWESLVNDIENGKVSKKVILSDRLREILDSKMKKNPKRAAQLRMIFEEGFKQPIATRIWPNLRRVIAAGTGNFEIYTEKLQKYIGQIPIYNQIYASSEALIANETEADSKQYIVNTENCFLEFLPEVEEGDKKPVTMEKLEIGKCYEVVITNNSGFYRYRLGDIIKVCGFGDGFALITYEYRVNQTFSFYEEKITEKNIWNLIKKLEEQYKIDINDFCFWADTDDTSYTIFMEPSEQTEMLDKIYKIEETKLEEVCDELLKMQNLKYRKLRDENKLNSCHVILLQPQTHLLYKDVERLRKKMAPDQIKPVRILDNPVKEKFFFSAIDRQYHSDEKAEYYFGRFRKQKFS